MTHATPIRLMGSVVKGLSLKEAGTFPWPGNASVTSLTYENGAFSLKDYSNDSFMGDIATGFSDL